MVHCSRKAKSLNFGEVIMPRNDKIVGCTLLACFVLLSTVWGQTVQPARPDLTKQPTLYVVPYAHLDTQWRWDYATTINTFLPDTMRMNFALFEKYPHYIFNFSGANRYRMMKEYYPAEYSKVKEYVKAGRWFPSGSSMEENDVNSPSAESIIRQILYGKQYFRREFGKTSAEFMLPDCFGFPASLPSILAHVGIRGFSTQKLSWHSAATVGGPDSPEKTPPGIPFNVGFWEGLDGKGVIAALNAMDYDGDVTYDISKSPPPAGPNARSTPTDWPKRVDINGKASGLFTDFYYYGTGDVGGSPQEASVRLMEAILTKSKTVLPPLPRLGPDQPAPPAGEEIIVGDGPLHITQASAEQMFLDIKPDQMAGLPCYKGDLELTEHSAGSLTSQAYLKRWNRKNELLADAAEKASVAASWLGGRPYPKERLNDAWTLVMGGQFHDIIPGTSIPKAYEYSWNDEVLAMNQFAGVLTSATQTVASGMNTQTQGTAIIVYNPLNIPREDVVEATVSFPGNTPKAVRVFGPDGEEVPAQLAAGKVLFLARVPSVGYAVYDVQAADSSLASTLQVTKSSLGNARYSIRLDHHGDVSGIFDKKLKKELLSAPARLALKLDKPVNWPAWNMDWTDQQKAARAYVSAPARIRIVENGPVRVALEITRKADGSKFVQTIRLSAGDAGNRVEFNNVIDWKSAESNLKAVFPLTASSPVATYNWDIGTVQRPNDNEKMFEYPSHQWFDLTDKSGAFGVTVLSDCKNASDKPNDTTLQLTLLRTPGIGTGNGRSYNDQSTQDWGHHEFVYGIAGHGGDWRNEQTDWQAQRLNQPLVAFESSKHIGPIGKSFSFLKVNNPRVRVLAVKNTESSLTSDEVVVRLVELDGQSKRDVRVSFAAPITAAREINGAEEPVGAATVTNGELVTAFTPYQVRSFAVELAAPAMKVAAPRSVSVALTYDRLVASLDGTKSAPGFDTKGFALPAEMLPADIAYAGIHFKLAPAGDGKPNAVLAKGQTITWPTGNFNRLYILAASAEGDQKAAFHIGDKSVDLTIQDWGGYIGQWDNRQWTTHQEQVPVRPGAPTLPSGTPPRMRTVMEFAGLVPGFIKQSPVAWFSSHQHTADGVNVPYAYSYLFAYSIDVPANARTLTLPDNDKIRILAISLASESGEVRPAQPLFDTLERPER
jgi:alpha-mannosidase